MDYKLTSVKILKELYKNFKSTTLDDEFTLTKTSKSFNGFICFDEDFQNKIHSYNNLIPSGSRL